jgi:hypothetical protein
MGRMATLTALALAAGAVFLLKDKSGENAAVRRTLSRAAAKTAAGRRAPAAVKTGPVTLATPPPHSEVLPASAPLAEAEPETDKAPAVPPRSIGRSRALAEKFARKEGLHRMDEVKTYLRYVSFIDPGSAMATAVPMEKDNPLLEKLRGRFRGVIDSLLVGGGRYRVAVAFSTEETAGGVEGRMQVRFGRSEAEAGELASQSAVKYLPPFENIPPATMIQLTAGSFMQLYFDEGRGRWIGNLYVTDPRGVYVAAGATVLERADPDNFTSPVADRFHQ